MAAEWLSLVSPQIVNSNYRLGFPSSDKLGAHGAYGTLIGTLLRARTVSARVQPVMDAYKTAPRLC
jgi:hypothetical protein